MSFIKKLISRVRRQREVVAPSESVAVPHPHAQGREANGRFAKK